MCREKANAETTSETYPPPSAPLYSSSKEKLKRQNQSPETWKGPPPRTPFAKAAVTDPREFLMSGICFLTVLPQTFEVRAKGPATSHLHTDTRSHVTGVCSPSVLSKQHVGRGCVSSGSSPGGRCPSGLVGSLSALSLAGAGIPFPRCVGLSIKKLATQQLASLARQQGRESTSNR